MEEFVTSFLEHSRELARPVTGRGPLKHMAWGQWGAFACKTVVSSTNRFTHNATASAGVPDTEGDARPPASLFVLVRHNEESQVN